MTNKLTSVLALFLLLNAACGGDSYDGRKKSGIEAYQEGRLEEAVEILDQCSRENSRDFDVRYYLARGQSGLGRVPVALREWNDVLILRPEFVEGHYRKGNCLISIGKTEEAIEAWSRAVELDPTYFHAHYNKGRAYEELEKWDHAAASYLKTLEADSTFEPAYINLGLLFQRAEEWDHAFRVYDMALRHHPGNKPLYMNRIRVLIHGGHKKEAASYIRDFLENGEPPEADRESLHALLDSVEAN